MRSVIEDYKALLPRIREADKYKNRPLMLSLINPLIERMKKKINAPLCSEAEMQVYTQVIRELKQHIIMSAWHKDEDDGYTKEIFREREQEEDEDIGIPFDDEGADEIEEKPTDTESEDEGRMGLYDETQMKRDSRGRSDDLSQKVPNSKISDPLLQKNIISDSEKTLDKDFDLGYDFITSSEQFDIEDFSNQGPEVEKPGSESTQFKKRKSDEELVETLQKLIGVIEEHEADSAK